MTYYIQPEIVQQNITYIDKNGVEQTLTPEQYIILDGSAELNSNNRIYLNSDKFYVVNGDVN